MAKTSAVDALSSLKDTVQGLIGGSVGDLKVSTIRHLELAQKHLENALKIQEAPEPKISASTMEQIEFSQICKSLTEPHKYMLGYVGKQPDRRIGIKMMSSEIKVLIEHELLEVSEPFIRVTEKGSMVLSKWSGS